MPALEPREPDVPSAGTGVHPKPRSAASVRAQMRSMFTPGVIVALLAGFVPFLVIEMFNQTRDAHGGQVWSDPLPYTLRVLVLAAFAFLAARQMGRRPRQPVVWSRVAVWTVVLTALMWPAAGALALPAASGLVSLLWILGILVVLTIVLAFIPGGAYVIQGVWWLVGTVVFGAFWLVSTAVGWLLNRFLKDPTAPPPASSASQRLFVAGPVDETPEPEYVDRWANWQPFGGHPPRSRAQDATGGQIWWAELPFDDNPLDAKDRPVLIVENTGTDLVVAKITSKDKSTRPDFIKVPDGTDGLGDTCGYLSLRTTTITYDEVRRYGGNPGPKFLIRYNRARDAYEQGKAERKGTRKRPATSAR